MSRAMKVAIVTMVGLSVVVDVLAVLVMALLQRDGGGPPVAAGALERVRQRGELRVIMDTGTPPWTGLPPMYLLDDGGKPDGFDYRLALEIARAAGVGKVTLVHSSYMDFAATLQKDPEADIVLSGFTPYAAPGLSWSEPYLEFGLCLIVAADGPIRSVNDLWGKQIGIYPDDAAEKEVTRMVKGFSGLQRIESGYFDLLLTGKLDAFIYDFPFAVAEIQTHYDRFPHQKGKLRIAQYNLTDSTYAVATRSADADLLALVNRTIAAWRGTTAYIEAMRAFLPAVGSVDLPVAESVPEQKRYTVGAGETLSTIAARQLGGADRWRELWLLNKSRIPNPNLLEVGDQLALP